MQKNKIQVFHNLLGDIELPILKKSAAQLVLNLKPLPLYKLLTNI